jgi:hypothetical protein
MSSNSITIDELIRKGSYAVFHPLSKLDLRFDHPELKDSKAMKLDNPRKSVFVWHYANKCSRARELHDDRQRIAYAMRMAWGTKVPPEIKETYPERRWGQAVQEAIDQMRRYEPEPRMIMKLLAVREMEKVQKMLEENAEIPKTGSELEKYMKARQESFKLLDYLRPMTELLALGVTEITEEQEEEEGQAMQDIDEIILP